MTQAETVYVAAWERWIREGKLGTPPSSVEHGVRLCDLTNELAEMESAIRQETGLSSWIYWGPDYYDPMMELRRAAVAAGTDPDVAAMKFHAKYMKKDRRMKRNEERLSSQEMKTNLYEREDNTDCPIVLLTKVMTDFFTARRSVNIVDGGD